MSSLLALAARVPLFLPVFLLLVAAFPAAAGFLQTSPLAHDTVNLQSYTEYLRDGLTPPGYHKPEDMSYEEYQARYPRDAIVSSAWCWSGNTARPWCRADLHFADTTLSLNGNSFFSRDSLMKASPQEGPYYVFEEHFDRRVKAILESRDYALQSLDLTRYTRTDRANGALFGGFMLVPSFVLALVVEKGIAVNTRKPYSWGHVGLLTGGFMVGAGVTYAIGMDPEPRLSLTRIRFSPGKSPLPQELPPKPPLREILE